MNRLNLPDARQHVGVIALITLIVIVSSVGGLLIHAKYRDVEDQSVLIQTEVFREGLFTLRELARLTGVLNTVAQSGTFTDEQRIDLRDAYDFLYVRTEALGRHARRLDHPHMKAAETQLLGIIALGDQELAREPADIYALRNQTAQMIDNIGMSVARFVDAQYERQADMIAGQVAMLRSLVAMSLAFLATFTLLAIISVIATARQYRLQVITRAAEQNAAFLAYYDPLTELPNRLKFKREASRLVEGNDAVLLLVMDLDNFKNINDLNGQHIGDAVLKNTARILRDVAAERYDGAVARIGGDEFTAAIPGPFSSMRTAAICEELIREIATPFEVDGTLLTPSASVGVVYAPMIPDIGQRGFNELQKAAEFALSRAKSEGKNTYAFYDEELSNEVARRNYLEAELRKALARDEGLHLAYQPQIDLRDGRVTGFEALARWTLDETFISPGEFIPVAEYSGQVVELDRWCFRTAMHMLAGWIAEGAAPVTMSTNFSPPHFKSSEIVDFVREVLAETGLDPKWVTLEVTESMMITDVSTTMRVLESLRALGVSIALDDFGTGYSSLAHLRRLDLDCIKIDQSFVRDLADSTETKVVMQSLVTIAKGLKKKLVVEGIETEDQADILRGLKCDVGQGYLFGRPVPADAARAMIPDARAQLSDAG